MITENNWIPLNVILIHSKIKELHVDTRKFLCLLLDKNSNEDENCKNINKLIENQNALEENIIEEKNVFSWLQMINNISYGKFGYRRTLNFDRVNISFGGWLKYIRLYRYNDHQFIVCDSLSIPINYRDCTKDNLSSTYTEGSI